MLSPGSMTMASRLSSSPKMEQLHCRIPTGRISWIITRLYTHDMAEVLGVIMRWLHISSVATLVGGILYARLVLVPAAEGVGAASREELHERAAALYRPLLFSAVAAFIVSGIYNLVATP